MGKSSFVIFHDTQTLKLIQVTLTLPQMCTVFCLNMFGKHLRWQIQVVCSDLFFKCIQHNKRNTW